MITIRFKKQFANRINKFQKYEIEHQYENHFKKSNQIRKSSSHHKTLSNL